MKIHIFWFVTEKEVPIASSELSVLCASSSESDSTVMISSSIRIRVFLHCGPSLSWPGSCDRLWSISSGATNENSSME